jgi:thiol-disulfide isomerase/thioredoxin
MKSWIGAILVAALLQQSQPQQDPETRVVNYLKANVRPGQPVEVSKLVNEVFKTPEERKVLDRLFNTFFKIPVAIVEFQARTGRIPRLQELSEQFDFKVPGQMDVMLRIMESDPRVPKFLTRNSATGEITKVDVAAIKKDPRFSSAVNRTIAGWEGQLAPGFAMVSLAKQPVNSAQYRGKPHLLYFWFTNCPPCVQTTPSLVKLYDKYQPKGFEMIAANADQVLGLPYSDTVRADYIRKQRIRFAVGHLTPRTQQDWGGVTLFPTLFFVNRQGRIVKHMVNLQSEATLEAAILEALK